MPDALKQQLWPLTGLAALLVAATVGTMAHQRLKQERRAFSIEHYERLMQRVGVAIESISDTMAREGMAADFTELLSRTKPDLADGEPVSVGAVERMPITLTGIVWNPTVPLAFINGQTVGQGDRVGDAEIVRIGKESVSVRYPDKTEQTVSLSKE